MARGGYQADLARTDAPAAARTPVHLRHPTRGSGHAVVQRRGLADVRPHAGAGIARQRRTRRCGRVPSQHYGAPVMLMALLLGMAMNFLSTEGACVSGIDFTARTVLRTGVALLGLRITLVQIAALGWQPIALVLLSVTLTIGTAIIVARLLGFRAGFGLLSGGATAICGASAALAIAAALPNHPLKERATLFTVLGVSALSTLAMIVYPMLVHALGLGCAGGRRVHRRHHSRCRAGGRRGLQPSPETGDVATFVKLLRVAMLLPVIAITVVSYRRLRRGAGREAAAIVARLCRRVRRACRAEQPRCYSTGANQARRRHLAMVPGRGRRGTGTTRRGCASRHRLQAGRDDGRRDGVSCPCSSSCC